jgi:uncharacterized protein involved in exopolysaccharide biosynthesis
MATAPAPLTARPVRPPEPEAALEFRTQIQLLWRHWRFIAAVAAALAVAGGVFSLARVREFEAAAVIAVSPPRLGDQTPAPVQAEAFVPLLENQSVAARIAQEFKLTEPPYRLAASALIGEVITVRPVVSSGLIRIVARIDDPEVAANLANRFAAESIEAVRKAGRDEVAAIEQALQPVLSDTAAQLQKAEKSYDEFRRTARLELLTKEVGTLLDQRSDLMKVTVELAAARAGLGLVEQEVAKREQVTSLRQNVTEAPALTEAARGSTSSARELMGLEMRREESNPVFAALDEKAATTRAEVASLERQRTQLTSGVSEKELSRLSELYERESVLARLDLERKLARTAYEAAATRYQGARVAVLGRVPQLLVVDTALPPDRPLSRYLARNVLIGLAVGTLLAAIAVLAREALRAPQP